MDNETIKALFDEDFCEASSYRPSDEEYIRTNEKSSSAYDALVAQLDETSQALLENFLDLHDSAAYINRKYTFVNGFSIATKLLTEALYTPISK